MAALDEDLDAQRVAARHFDTALQMVIPQTSKEKVEMYEKYSKTLQSAIK